MPGVPISAIIMIAVFLLRVANSSGSSGTAGQGRRLKAPTTDLFDSAAYLFAPIALFVALMSGIYAGWWAGVLPLVAGMVLLESWLVARVAIRLRWPRLAYGLTRVSTLAFRHDRLGGARFAWALAAIGDPPPSADPPPWAPLTRATLVAHGLLAHARGDRDEARSFLRAAVELFEGPASPDVDTARDWLDADAVARGAWSELLGWASSGSVRSLMVRSVAHRRLGLDVPFPPDLRLRIRLALGERALAAWQRELAVVAAPVVWPPLPEGALPAALEQHRRAAWRPDAVRAAVEAWDLALVGADPALRASVVADLLEIARAHRTPASALEGSAIGREVADRLRDEWFGQLDLAVTGLRGPPRESLLDEVRELLAARALYVDLVAFGGPSARRTAFHRLLDPFLSRTVDLYNVRTEGYLFRALTRWLRGEAAAVGNQRMVGLLDNNLRIAALWAVPS